MTHAGLLSVNGSFVLAFEFEKVPFDFVKKVSIAAGVSTKKSEVNPNPILPLDDRLKQLIFQVPRFLVVYFSPFAQMLS